MIQPSAPLAAALSDDLTGALGLSVLIANENIPVRALTAVEDDYDPSGDAGRVVVINTNSRNLSREEARNAVTSAVRQFPPETAIVKRFDTTLRGHLGTELAAILEQRPQAAAIIVPSYPASGRLCVGGYQQNNGIPIERTEAARDPHWPISHSYVADYFSMENSSLTMSDEVDHISLREVESGLESLSYRIDELMRPGAKVVIDAYSDGDIAMIVRATQAINRELIFVSPGAFLGLAIGVRHRRENHRVVVAAIGSAAELTRRQVLALEEKYTLSYLDLPISMIAEDGAEKAVKRFLDGWNPKKTDILVIRPEGRRADSSLGQPILSSLARAIQSVTAMPEVELAGLILSGGETAMTTLERLGITSIRPEVEFGSLVMGGVILNGPLGGMKIVTKGGLVGGPSILLKTMTWFLRKTYNEE